ncbi:META domain-containing protein [Verminephrobacter eiseniae]|nr:META domain-containing protein [Verminephrobacter eiseniae]MCW5282934.1 META domain-containing protein [Verminephrobacter eiseniae]MCW5303249.1 META domain-containing protein [Verminephrobacter eiseniae]MCW8178164.1 META domain-containing protein [Verminephrobacter eiseniae]MCW8188642.1 META domain-containing protein [Verminephrobacter eiseniae]
MAARSLRHLIGGAALVCALLAGCASRPPAPDAVVSGVALTRERVLLPPEAVFEATLLDVTDPDRPPVVLGRQRRAPAGPAPYAIWIAYPSAHFLPQGRYEVRASVTLQGRLLLASNRRHPVPQAPAWRHVDVLLERLRPQPATQQAAVPLTLTHWRLVAIDAETLPRPAEGEVAPHLVLQAGEARATGSGGCNRFLADYALQDAQLRFGRLVSNIALCLRNGALEQRFFAALGAVHSFDQQGRQLLLRGAQGQPLLRLEAAETALR